MQTNSPLTPYGIPQQQLQNSVRERDPNCIEMHLNAIEVELAESVNSANSLADKLRGYNTHRH